jgi:Tol biopolymer transport system component
VPVSASKDGKLLLFTSSDPKTGDDLSLLRLDSRQASLFVDSPDQEDFGQISPDGKWIAYTVRAGVESSVWVRPVPEMASGNASSRWRDRECRDATALGSRRKAALLYNADR